MSSFMNQISQRASLYVDNHFNNFPLISKPAVRVVDPLSMDRSSYQKDAALIAKRVVTAIELAFVALALTFTALLAGKLSLALSPFVAITIVLTTVAISLYEYERADKELDARAVNEYLTKEKPSYYANVYIRTHLSAAQLFIRMKCDVNKLDDQQEKGMVLLEMNCSSSETAREEQYRTIFTLLVDYSGEKPLVNIKEICNYVLFGRLGCCHRPKSGNFYLEYLLKNRKLTTKYFTSDELKALSSKVNEEQKRIFDQYRFQIDG